MQIIGATLGCIAIIYISVEVYFLLLQVKLKSKRSKLSYSLLHNQFKNILLQRTQYEQERLSWKGVRKFSVSSKVHETGDVCSFYFEPVDGKPLPIFRPGQFLTFKLNIPGQDKTVTRCYSISSVPNSKYYRVTIKLVPDGLVSSYFHNQVEPGAILDLLSPQGVFYIEPTTQKPLVLIAGGVGITPLISMMGSMDEARSNAEVILFYAVRDKNSQILKNSLKNLAYKNTKIRVYVAYSHLSAEDKIDPNSEFSGRLTVDHIRSVLPSSNYDFYICGPPPMMKSMIDGLQSWEVPKDNIYTEAFGTSSLASKSTVASANKEDPTKASEKEETQFSVSFSKSNIKQKWECSYDSLLSFAEEAGVAIDSGCRVGNCGTCETAIISGSVRYQVASGYQCEEGRCLPCICTPEGELELDT